MKFFDNFAANFKLWPKLWLLPALVMLAILFYPGSSLAAGDPGNSGSSAVAALSEICGTEMVDSQSGQLKIFSVGVKCFEHIVNGLAEKTIRDFSRYLRNIVYTALVLYLIFFGSKISLGLTSGEKVKSEFMIHALKIAFVAWLVFSLGLLDIYSMVLGSYHSMIDIVMAGADFGDCQQGTSFTSSGTDAVWATMDCMFAKFIGWEAQNGFGGKAWPAIPLLFGIISSKILPANGFIIGGLLLSTLLSLLMGFFRLAFVYILSLIALILLFSISPMIMPMMLFKQTKQYFDGWVRLVISMVLQPVILFAFFAFIASLLTDTIDKLKDMFSKLKLTYETSSVGTTGVQPQINQLLSAGNNIDKELVLSAITTLVIAMLLVSFISFVSRMAQELAGHGTAPELGSGEYAPSMLGGRRR
jgi:type IV secretory pathway VirB6-like protein